MGIIQSAVNQALGTVGTVAGIGRVMKTGQESVDLQKKAAEEATAEREKKKAYAAQLEAEVKKDPSLQPTVQMTQVGEDEFEAEETEEITPRSIYMRNQLANVYEESGQFGEAFELRERAKADQDVLNLMEQQRQRALAESQVKKDLKAEQDRQSKAFQKKFIEGIAEIKGINAIEGISEKKYADAMKGVRSVTTFGADTGDPYLRSRTVYTPGREEVK